MDIKNFLSAAKLRPWLAAVAAILVLVVVFAAGVLVGYQKAQFSFRWGLNYYQNIMGPPQSPPDQGFLAAHDSLGQIIQINGSQIIVRSDQGTEKGVVLTAQTVIRKGSNTISAASLQTNNSVVVIGEPDSRGQIEAKFIRVLNY